jgi:hypothetical protein
MQDQPKFAIVHEVIGRTGSRGQVCYIKDTCRGTVILCVECQSSKHDALSASFLVQQSIRHGRVIRYMSDISRYLALLSFPLPLAAALWHPSNDMDCQSVDVHAYAHRCTERSVWISRHQFVCIWRIFGENDRVRHWVVLYGRYTSRCHSSCLFMNLSVGHSDNSSRTQLCFLRAWFLYMLQQMPWYLVQYARICIVLFSM